MIYPLKSYFRHLLSSRSRYRVHSPFVFELIREALKDKGRHDYPQSIEELRKELRKDRGVFLKKDFGTGGMNGTGYPVSTRAIATGSSSSRRKGRLLYRISKYFQPRTLIEMGTALGIGTAYLASASPGARIFSLEGCPELANRASSHLRRLKITNVEILEGEFSESLSVILTSGLVPDLVFIDGNHKKEAVTSYFNRLLPYVHNNTVLIFDDIHWSREMSEGWSEITGNPRVTVSIDLFHTGLVFFRKESTKQHFVIRY